MKNLLFFSLVLLLAGCLNSSVKNPIHKLTGKWQSVTDATYQLEFTKEKLKHIHNGKVTEVSTIMADSACKSLYCMPAENPAQGFCFNEKGPYGEQCNLVLFVDNNRLEYTLVGGRGNTVIFTKIK